MKEYQPFLHALGRLPAVALTHSEEDTPCPDEARAAPPAPSLPVLHPHAAGIDIGATELYVCVPLDRDPQPIRRFGTFTEDLLAVAIW